VRDAVFELLRERGIRHIFGNPGSTELPMLAGLPQDLRYVLCLHESVAVSAADGYALASGEPALVNVHTTAGLGNAMGAISTAAWNKAPVIVTAGQQDTRHLRLEPLLSGPLEEIAKPLVKWSHQPVRAADVPMALERAFRIAITPPTGPVFVSIPMDFMEKDAEAVSPHTPSPPGPPDKATLDSIAAALSSARRPALVTGAALEASGGWQAAIQVAESFGLEVYAAPNAAQTGFPTAHANFRAYLPNNAAALKKSLEPHDLVLVVGAPVFVMYPYIEGPYLSPDTRLILLTDDPQEASRMERGEAHLGDLCGGLEGLLDSANPAPRALEPQSIPPEPEEESNVSLLAALHAISRHYSPQTILVDESISSGAMMRRVLRTHRARSYMRASSGGLGYGMPAAVGAQLARPSAPVLAVVGDGSAMYAPQALWTAVREQLPIKVVILNNGGYSILKNFNQDFFSHLGTAPGLDLFDLDLPALARSMGVTAASVSAREDLEKALEALFSSRTAYLLDIRLDGLGRREFSR
jgi:benzoylformate decarboxylase